MFKHTLQVCRRRNCFLSRSIPQYFPLRVTVPVAFVYHFGFLGRVQNLDKNFRTVGTLVLFPALAWKCFASKYTRETTLFKPWTRDHPVFGTFPITSVWCAGGGGPFQLGIWKKCIFFFKRVQAKCSLDKYRNAKKDKKNPKVAWQDAKFNVRLSWIFISIGPFTTHESHRRTIYFTFCCPFVFANRLGNTQSAQNRKSFPRMS